MITTAYLWQWAVGLLVLVGLLGLVWRLAPHWGPQLRQRLGLTLSLQEQLLLDPRYRLVRVHSQRHSYLLLLGPQQAHVL